MHRIAFVVVAALSLAAVPSLAQAPRFPAPPFSFELRAGGTLPVGRLAADGPGAANGTPGHAYGFSFQVSPVPQAGMYAGYSFGRFGIDEESAYPGEPVSGASLRDRGAHVGLRGSFPAGPVRGWVSGGLVYRSVQFEARHETEGHTKARSTQEFGWEAGGGVEVPLTAHLSVTPGVAYVRYNPGVTAATRMEYLRADVGLRYRL